jgi:tetratricopeptide (TPR) repeat protein
MKIQLDLGYFYAQGRLKEAQALFERALAGREKELGPDHPSTLISVNNVAVLLQDQGRLKEAQPLYERALDGKEKELGPNHPSTLTSVNNLARLLKAQGRLQEA